VDIQRCRADSDCKLRPSRRDVQADRLGLDGRLVSFT
jgi:hypothetical protein